MPSTHVVNTVFAKSLKAKEGFTDYGEGGGRLKEKDRDGERRDVSGFQLSETQWTKCPSVNKQNSHVFNRLSLTRSSLPFTMSAGREQLM